jgi:hypothetical protein
MGWFDKKTDDTKGKSEIIPPDEKKTDQSKSEADLLIEKIGISIEAKMKPIADKVDAIQSKWNALEEAAKKPPEKKVENNEPAKRVTLADASMDDEAERQWKEQNILPAYVEMAKVKAEMIETRVLASLSADFDFLKPDIQKVFDETPIQRKAAADYGAYCANCVKMVLGDAALKAGLRSQVQGDKRRFFLEDGSSKQGTETGLEAQDADFLKKKLGIDPAEFAKGTEVH